MKKISIYVIISFFIFLSRVNVFGQLKDSTYEDSLKREKEILYSDSLVRENLKQLINEVLVELKDNVPTDSIEKENKIRFLRNYYIDTTQYRVNKTVKLSYAKYSFWKSRANNVMRCQIYPSAKREEDKRIYDLDLSEGVYEIDTIINQHNTVFKIWKHEPYQIFNDPDVSHVINAYRPQRVIERITANSDTIFQIEAPFWRVPYYFHTKYLDLNGDGFKDIICTYERDEEHYYYDTKYRSSAAIEEIRIFDPKKNIFGQPDFIGNEGLEVINRSKKLFMDIDEDSQGYLSSTLYRFKGVDLIYLFQIRNKYDRIELYECKWNQGDYIFVKTLSSNSNFNFEFDFKKYWMSHYKKLMDYKYTKQKLVCEKNGTKFYKNATQTSPPRPHLPYSPNLKY